MFQWAVIEHSDTHDFTFSLLEVVDGKATFWASILLAPTPDYKFDFVSFDSCRVLRQLPFSAPTVRKAQGWIVDYLKHEKVLPKKYKIPQKELYVPEVYPINL
jgi:hypothetical protein